MMETGSQRSSRSDLGSRNSRTERPLSANDTPFRRVSISRTFHGLSLNTSNPLDRSRSESQVSQNHPHPFVHSREEKELVRALKRACPHFTSTPLKPLPDFEWILMNQCAATSLPEHPNHLSFPYKYCNVRLIVTLTEHPLHQELLTAAFGGRGVDTSNKSLLLSTSFCPQDTNEDPSILKKEFLCDKCNHLEVPFSQADKDNVKEKKSSEDYSVSMRNKCVSCRNPIKCSYFGHAAFSTTYYNPDLGVEVLHIPIRDFCTPDPSQVWYFIKKVDEYLDKGYAVMTHCLAGLGRTGTMFCCYLAARFMRTRSLQPFQQELGVNPHCTSPRYLMQGEHEADANCVSCADSGIAWCRQRREGSIQSPAQIQYVKDWWNMMSKDCDKKEGTGRCYSRNISSAPSRSITNLVLPNFGHPEMCPHTEEDESELQLSSTSNGHSNTSSVNEPDNDQKEGQEDVDWENLAGRGASISLSSYSLKIPQQRRSSENLSCSSISSRGSGGSNSSRHANKTRQSNNEGACHSSTQRSAQRPTRNNTRSNSSSSSSSSSAVKPTSRMSALELLGPSKNIRSSPHSTQTLIKMPSQDVPGLSACPDDDADDSDFDFDLDSSDKIESIPAPSVSEFRAEFSSHTVTSSSQSTTTASASASLLTISMSSASSSHGLASPPRTTPSSHQNCNQRRGRTRSCLVASIGAGPSATGSFSFGSLTGLSLDLGGFGGLSAACYSPQNIFDEDDTFAEPSETVDSESNITPTLPAQSLLSESPSLSSSSSASAKTSMPSSSPFVGVGRFSQDRASSGSSTSSFGGYGSDNSNITEGSSSIDVEPHNNAADCTDQHMALNTKLVPNPVIDLGPTSIASPRYASSVVREHCPFTVVTPKHASARAETSLSLGKQLLKKVKLKSPVSANRGTIHHSKSNGSSKKNRGSLSSLTILAGPSSKDHRAPIDTVTPVSVFDSELEKDLDAVSLDDTLDTKKEARRLSVELLGLRDVPCDTASATYDSVGDLPSFSQYDPGSAIHHSGIHLRADLETHDIPPTPCNRSRTRHGGGGCPW